MTHEYTPWKVTTADWDENGNVRYVLDGVKEIRTSDAALISSAPQLLDALEECYKVFRMDEVDTAISLKVGMAISKAKAKEPQ